MDRGRAKASLSPVISEENQENPGKGADWPGWSKKVSPEATFRCGLAVRCSKSFGLCRNTKTKDSSPALLLLGREKLQSPAQYCPPHPILQQQMQLREASEGQRPEALQSQRTSRGHHRPTFGKKIHLPFPYKGLRPRGRATEPWTILGTGRLHAEPGPWVRADTGQRWEHKSPWSSEAGGFRGPSLTGPRQRGSQSKQQPGLAGDSAVPTAHQA